MTKKSKTECWDSTGLEINKLKLSGKHNEKRNKPNMQWELKTESID